MTQLQQSTMNGTGQEQQGVVDRDLQDERYC